MLMLDDNMLKLAKMQETLLRVSFDNRKENLEKYKDIVVRIDKQTFSSFLNELDLVDNHNQSLEEELQFLENIRDNYNQLLEMQLNFVNVCELYGDNDLKLSDLSQIDIEYIEKRIGIISGYLINLKNIEINKKKLQELNDKLILEEKKKIFLNKKLLEYEDLLIDNFENAEGRIIVNGQLKYISVVTEYKTLGYDFKLLLEDSEKLKDLLIQVNNDNIEIEEKKKTAEICYNTNPGFDSKQILNEISNDFFKIRYKLTMLKILDLLSKKMDDYELFKEKRENMLDLINYRLVCLKNLGEHISIDPFARTKIDEQMDSLKSMNDNSKIIGKITKEISVLSERIDEMISKNDEYRIELNDRRDLVISNFGMDDVVESLVDDNNILGTCLMKPKLDNQVVSIKDGTSKINMSIVKQKTNSVIKRVYQMVDKPKESKKSEILDNSFVVAPELVIIDSLKTFDNEAEEMVLTDIDDDKKTLDSSIVETSKVEESKNVDSNVVSFEYDNSMFETIEPFLQAPLFLDKTDEVDEPKIERFDETVSFSLDGVSKISNSNDDDNLDLISEDSEMPDAFWVTQEEKENNMEEKTISFDEQVAALMSPDGDNKIKKLVA